MIINLTTNTILRAISRLAPRYAMLLCVWFLEKAITVAPKTAAGQAIRAQLRGPLEQINKLLPKRVELAQKEFSEELIKALTCETCGATKRNYKTTDGTETKENVLLCPVCWK